MKFLSYNWFCPLCNKQGALFGGAKPSDVYLRSPGGGRSVCTKCAKNRKEEIDKENEIYEGDLNKKKNDNCKHEWQLPYMGRWYCTKCGATYNLTCGCGGSSYVCKIHYDEFVTDAIKEEGSLEKYLAKYSWDASGFK